MVGGCFSTFYRIALIAMATSSATLSIMSATSCEFVIYDHHYDDEALSGQDTSTPIVNVRNLSPIQSSSSSGSTRMRKKDKGEAGVRSQVAVSVRSGDDRRLRDTGSDQPAPPAAAPPTHVPVPGVDAPSPTNPTRINDAPAAPVASALSPVETGGTEESNDTLAPTSSPAETGGAGSSFPPSTPPAAAPPTDVPVPGGDAPSPTKSTGTDDAPAVPLAPASSPVETGGTEESNDTLAPTSSPAETGEAGSSFPPPSPGFSSGTTLFPTRSDLEVNFDAAAQVTGSAGLFCDTIPTIERIKSIFTTADSLKNFEKSISEDSEDDMSEEIARNGVVVASIFGILSTFILTVEFLIGRRMCLEKWIIGTFMFVACIAQGVTFVFFNSNQHCDGDIINEIINNKPCFLGKGANMSVAAIVLYFMSLVMVCRAPSSNWTTPLKRFRKDRTREEDERGSRERLGELELNETDSDSMEGGGSESASRMSGPDRLSINRGGRHSETPEWMGNQETRENEII